MRKYSTILLVAFSFLLVVNAKAQLTSGEYSNEGLVLSNLSSMPLAFAENKGQFGEKTLFKAEAGGATFYFCRDEVAYLFVRDTDELIEDDIEGWHAFPKDKHAQVFDQSMPPAQDSRSGLEETRHPRYKKESLLIKAQFVGANPNPEVIGADRLPHNNNYFLGNDPSKWRTDVPNYSTIIYKDIYPGIDLKYYGDGHSMKYDFIVNPGADISRIRIRYEGVDDLSVTPAGDLQAQTRFGLIHEKAPLIYQEIGGVKQEVAGRYEITGAGVFGFVIEDGFNPAYPLVIDPELVYSTYLGGDNDDVGSGIAVDGSGNAYVTGDTFSSDFPTVDPYDGSHNGGWDVFVTKFSAAGNSLDYSTYLGGSGNDHGYGIAVDGSGNAYVTGDTFSSDFPTVDPYDGSYNGNRDVFVTKFSAAGNSLDYSTYLGGSGNDHGYGIAVAGSGNAYVTGFSGSSDFPTVNPYDGSHNGGWDVFVTKFSAGGNSLDYSTFLGGSSFDFGYGIAVDGSGNAYVTGYSGSSDFPTVNPYDGSYNGGDDVFVTKFSAAGNSLDYSTYLGGSSDDSGIGIAVDGSGNVYVTGWTGSSDFPTVDPCDGSYNGGDDVFVTKFSAAGNSLDYSTYLGGSGNDSGIGIAVDGSGNVYVTGWTESSDFPTVDPYDGSHNGGWDVFVTKLSAAGNSLDYSTYLGGNGYDYGYGIAVGSQGNAYVIGTTNSSDFPTVNPYDGIFNGGTWDGFVAKFDSLQTDIDEIEPLPLTSELMQNYPNPFNAFTEIGYVLPKPQYVRIDIYDLLGRKVEILADEEMQAGHHLVLWDASDHSSGIYFYRIEAGDFVETRKMILLK